MIFRGMMAAVMVAGAIGMIGCEKRVIKEDITPCTAKVQDIAKGYYFAAAPKGISPNSISGSCPVSSESNTYGYLAGPTKDKKAININKISYQGLFPVMVEKPGVHGKVFHVITADGGVRYFTADNGENTFSQAVDIATADYPKQEELEQIKATAKELDAK